MSKISNLYLATIIVLVGFLVFGNSLFGGWAGDDKAQIVENNLVHHFSNFPLFFRGGTFDSGGNMLSGMFYKPLYVAYFSLIVNIFGVHPFPLHLFQLVGHITNAILVFYLFKKFIKRSVSFFLALIFLVHPMQVEAVAYIASSGEVFFCTFGLIALLLSMKKKQTPRVIGLTASCLLVSILFKESGVLFILLIGIYKILYHKKGLGVFLGVSALIVGFYAMLRFGVAKLGITDTVLSPIMRLSLAERFLTIPQIVVYYFQTFVFPLKLSYFQIWVNTSPAFTEFLLPLGLVLILSALFVSGAYYLFKARSKDFQAYCFFCIWLGLGLGVHLQIIPVEMTVAEHWFYFPMIGLLGAFGIFVQRIPGLYSKMAVCLVIVLLLLLSIRSIARNSNWKSNYTLFAHDITVDPNNYNIETSLGYEYFLRGDTDKAIQLFEQADSHQTDVTNLTNLGAAYMTKKEIGKSKQVLQRALDYHVYYGTVENMAVLLTTYEDPRQGRDFIKKYIHKYPNNAKLLMLLAICEYRLENKGEALRLAHHAYTISPDTNTEYVYSQIQNNQPISLE